MRFSDEDLNSFLQEHNTTQSLQHGRLMNGYALVPKELFYDTDVMQAYFQKSLDFVSCLKPKPTKKKASKK